MGNFQFTTCRSRLTIPAVSTNQNWKRVCVLLCQESRNRKLRSELFFLFPLPPTVQFDVAHQHLDLRHKQHTNSCKQHVLNFIMFLCFSDIVGIVRDSVQLWEAPLTRVLRPSEFFIWTSARDALQLVRCLHQLVLLLDSALIIVHIVGLCRFHFSRSSSQLEMLFSR